MLITEEQMYLKTYFRIETGYVWSEGHPDELSKKFKEEISQIFSKLGFKIVKPSMSCACYEVVRGKERLYCHPMNLSGEIKESSIPEIENALKNADFIKYRTVDTYDYHYDLDEASTLQLLKDKYSLKTRELILEKCKTTRKTKFVSLHLDSTPLKTVDKKVGVKAYQIFCNSIINELLDEGMLVRPSSESHFYRSLNKTEMKKLNLN